MFDPRDDARDRDGREDGRTRVYATNGIGRRSARRPDARPRPAARRGARAGRDRDRVYELDGEDSRTLAAVGAFRVVPEHDLDIDHDTLEHLHEEGLVETVDLGDDERGLTLTTGGPRPARFALAGARRRAVAGVLRRRQPRTRNRPRLESLRDVPAGGGPAPRRARRASRSGASSSNRT